MIGKQLNSWITSRIKGARAPYDSEHKAIKLIDKLAKKYFK